MFSSRSENHKFGKLFDGSMGSTHGLVGRWVDPWVTHLKILMGWVGLGRQKTRPVPSMECSHFSSAFFVLFPRRFFRSDS